MVNSKHHSVSRMKTATDKINTILLSVLPILLVSQFRPGLLPEIEVYFPGSFLSAINDLWKILQIISFLIILIMFLYNFNIDKLLLLYGLSLIFLLLGTVINGNPLSRFMSLVFSPIAVLLSMNIAKNKGVLKRLISSMYFYLVVLILINFFLVIVFPDSLFIDHRDMGVMYLFGNYQQNLNWFVMYIAISGYQYSISGNNKKYLYTNYAVYAAMLLTSLIVGSVTALISLLAMYSLIALFRYKETFAVYINPVVVFISGLFATIFIGVFDGLKYFSFIIEGIFNKTITMGSRTEFWTKAFAEIKESPILGQGFETAALSISKIGKSTAHNHYINLLYNGGVIYLILTFLMIFVVYRELKANQHNRYTSYISIALIGYFIYFITESRLNINELMFILSFAYYASVLFNASYRLNKEKR